VQARGYGNSWCDISAARALQPFTVRLAGRTQSIDSLSTFNDLFNGLYAACFIVLSYLVGARVSEILHWQLGCVQPLSGESTENPTSGSDNLAIIRGAIFKREPEYHGRPHEWVVPPPAVHAISVLEALSSPHRAHTQRTELWLRARGRPVGAREWLDSPPYVLRIPTDTDLRRSLNLFGAALGVLKQDRGRPWRLSTHQGRKTFARFAALRDRTALFALAQQLGHRERAITDHGYCGTDYQLTREIDAHILDQSVSAWEHMLSTPELGGRAGEEILAQRPRFRGARLKRDLKSYARTLVNAGLVLGVCDWGFCVYRQDHSACLGNAAGPDPVRREPATCARCKNFVLSSEHRPYWLDQARRHEALLNEPALPTQTLKIVRERLTQARTLLKSLARH
jgi:integrase